MSRRAPISFKRDYDPNDIKEVKLDYVDANGDKVKGQGLAIDGTSVEAMLVSIRDFRDLIQTMHLTTGPLRMDIFRRLTKGTARDDWDTASAGHNRTVAGFNHALQEFKECYIPTDARHAQRQYIRGLKKHNNTVRSFNNRLKTLCLLLTEFPGDATITINNVDRKEILFNAMPEAFRRQWNNADKQWFTSTEAEIVQYMEGQESQQPSNPGRSGGANNNHNGFHTNNSQASGGHSRGRRQAHTNSNNGRSNSRRPKKKQRRGLPDPEDECPIHGGHQWKDCFDNRRGNNYRPGRSPNQETTNQGQNNNRTRRGGYSGPTHGSVNMAQEITGNSQASLPPPPQNPPVPQMLYTSSSTSDNSSMSSQPTTPRPPGTFSTRSLTHHQFDQVTDLLFCRCLQSGTGTNGHNSPCSNCHMFVNPPVQASDHATVNKIKESVAHSLQKSLPIVLLSIHQIQQQKSHHAFFTALCDSGASHTFIMERVLPPGCQVQMAAPMTFQTASGVLSTNKIVLLREVSLPEISKSYTIQETWAYVLSSNTIPYDIVMGRPLLSQFGLQLNFQDHTIRWPLTNQSIAMKGMDQLHSMKGTGKNPVVSFLDQQEQFESFATELLDSKYEKVDVTEVARSQKHLTRQEQDDLLSILKTRTILFSGRLGTYKKRKIHLTLKPGAVPKHFPPYALPILQWPVFIKEMDRLVDTKVLARCGVSDWAAPTFTQPKKDGRIRILTDFRYLNSNLQRQVYPLPKIQDILTKRKGYRYFTKIDISMQYYTFMLDDESSWLCVTTTPVGKFRYLRLPMGVHMSPDIAQDIMDEIFQDMPEVDCYIDDVGIWSNTWEDHCRSVAEVLKRLETNGFTVNPRKCEWAVEETDWLGYWLTPKGLKPWRKKIEAILSLKPPQNVTQLRSFIGAITFYRDMWPKRSHLLAPLTMLTGKQPFKWGPDQQNAFDAIRALIAKDVMLRYPDHNLPFVLEADASDYQLGAVIKQNNVPVAFYSRKLNAAERNYTVTEKELLSIKATLHEFRTMLFGARIHVYTDHKNITYTTLNSQRVLRWRLLFEEFNVKFHYLPGKANHVADALSRLPRHPRKQNEPSPSPQKSSSTSLLDNDDPELLSLLFLHPKLPALPGPFNYQRIEAEQQRDPVLLALHQKYATQYPKHRFGKANLICYQPNENSQL